MFQRSLGNDGKRYGSRIQAEALSFLKREHDDGAARGETYEAVMGTITGVMLVIAIVKLGPPKG